MLTTRRLIGLFAVAVVATAAVVFLLISVFTRQQEARLNYFKVVEIAAGEVDPQVWGQNFPQQFDSWQNTLKSVLYAEYSKYGRYGGSDNYQKLDSTPT